MAFKFKPMQRAFLNQCSDKSQLLLVSSAGSGKTLALYGLFWLRQQQLNHERMVVFCKSKEMIPWKRDNLKKQLLTCISESKDLSIFFKNAQFKSSIYLFNISILNKLIRDGSDDQKRSFQRLLASTNILVLEEVHNLKSWKAQTSQSVRKVTDYYNKLIAADPTKYTMVACTATPVSRSPEDYYPIMGFVRPGLFGTYYNFCDNFVVYQDRSTSVGRKQYSSNGSVTVKGKVQFRQVLGYKNLDKLYQIVAPYQFVWDGTQDDASDRWICHHTLVEYTFTESELKKYREVIRGEGLDKDLIVSLETNNGDSIELYRSPGDEFVDPSGKLIQVRYLNVGSFVLIDNQIYRIKDIKEALKDGRHSLRVLRSSQHVGLVKDKVVKLVDIVKKHINEGCVIYCAYLGTVDFLYKTLVRVFAGHRVVAITGETADAAKVIAGLNPTDIVIISKAISQSQDLFQRAMVLYDPMTSPGNAVQLVGRICRAKASWREVWYYHLYSKLKIDHYFMSRLALFVKYVQNKGSLEGFPELKTLIGVNDDSKVNIEWLKKNILWRAVRA